VSTRRRVKGQRYHELSGRTHAWAPTMNRVSSFLQLAEAAKGNADLPAGADPYEDFDFSPYLSAEQTEEDLRKTWRVFTKVKVRCSGAFRRMDNSSSPLFEHCSHRREWPVGVAPAWVCRPARALPGCERSSCSPADNGACAFVSPLSRHVLFSCRTSSMMVVAWKTRRGACGSGSATRPRQRLPARSWVGPLAASGSPHRSPPRRRVPLP